MAQSSESTIRLRLYRALQSGLVEKLVASTVFTSQRVRDAKLCNILTEKFGAKTQGVFRAWFHGASVGELETLTPSIFEWVEKGHEVILTVLSESAANAVKKLGRELEKKAPGKVLFSGYSPWEGSWLPALARIKPDCFVTAKYEAWPELWASLGAKGTPLLVVGARPRRSLHVAKRLCGWLGASLPPIHLLAANSHDLKDLKRDFQSPAFRTHWVGEPRWDRVAQRAQALNPRIQQWADRFANLPRPWGLLGSVWPEDLEIWRGRYRQGAGTLWIVPHKTHDEVLASVENHLEKSGMKFLRISKSATAQPAIWDCLLVDELGCLLDLYSIADWAYIGGGFGEGIHSTIEPALFGIPVACGPYRAESFPEVAELRDQEQLTLVEEGEQLESWLSHQWDRLKDSRRVTREKKLWTARNQDRLGAGRRVVDLMLEVIGKVIQE